MLVHNLPFYFAVYVSWKMPREAKDYFWVNMKTEMARRGGCDARHNTYQNSRATEIKNLTNSPLTAGYLRGIRATEIKNFANSPPATGYLRGS